MVGGKTLLIKLKTGILIYIAREIQTGMFHNNLPGYMQKAYMSHRGVEVLNCIFPDVALIMRNIYRDSLITYSVKRNLVFMLCQWMKNAVSFVMTGASPDIPPGSFVFFFRISLGQLSIKKIKSKLKWF